MFLAFLTIAVQILVNLYTTSVVTAAAYDAARMVAVQGQPLDDRDKEGAEARVRERLGGIGESAELTWDDSQPGVIRLRVVATSPRFLLPVVDGALGLDVIDRTVTVRLEQLQQ